MTTQTTDDIQSEIYNRISECVKGYSLSIDQTHKISNDFYEEHKKIIGTNDKKIYALLDVFIEDLPEKLSQLEKTTQ